MGHGRIFFFCPDDDTPFGGTKMLYRQVEVLQAAGFEAFALHRTPNYKYHWFQGSPDIETVSNVSWRPTDVLVIPEVFGREILREFPVPKKVIYNQNCYFTFKAHFGLSTEKTYIPYLDSQVLATLVVSEDSADYLRYAFPAQRIFRISHSIDASIFYPLEKKSKQIAFMPRKNTDDVIQVLNLLKYRGALEGYELKPISQRSEQEVAAILRSANIFLSFGHPEGFGLPPFEAMASEAYVIGYHGRGGREFLKSEFSSPVEMGDVIGFAKSVEEVVKTWESSPETIQSKTSAARAFIMKNYSREREVSSILGAWREIQNA